MANLPAIWRDSAPDKPVAKRDAIAAWSDAAWAVLESVASSYGGFITYDDLGRRLQSESGVRTSMQLEHWIRDALEPVVKRILADPSRAPLVALAVQPDGDVARWYASRGRPAFRSGDERQAAAAEDRLACYVAHADDVPDDAAPRPVTVPTPEPAGRGRSRRSGSSAGSGASSPRGSSPRASSTSPRAAARRAEERPVAVCPTCNMQLRPDGGCDLCD